MKRLVLIVLSLILVISVADARRKKDYAGVVKDNVYQDSKYDLQLKINDNWKASPGEENSSIRLVLIQKKYAIPNDYRDAPDYTYIPKMVVWADTSSWSATAFLDSMLSPTFKSKQKSALRTDFDMLNQQDVMPRGKRMFTLTKETAVQWDGEAKYAMDIQSSSSSNAGVHVNRKYHAAIISVKHGSTIYLFHIMCEDDFREAVLTEATGMVNNLVFAKAGQ
jgi:hypothetical protein